MQDVLWWFCDLVWCTICEALAVVNKNVVTQWDGGRRIVGASRGGGMGIVAWGDVGRECKSDFNAT